MRQPEAKPPRATHLTDVSGMGDGGSLATCTPPAPTAIITSIPMQRPQTLNTGPRQALDCLADGDTHSSTFPFIGSRIRILNQGGGIRAP